MSKVLRGKEISANRIARRGDKAQKITYPEGRFGASLRNIRVAPNKVRLVIDLIRGEPVERAREILRYTPKRAAYMVDRVLLSALGNADAKSQGALTAEELYVCDAYCDEGPRLKRHKAGPMGRARPIIRRMAHITVVLGEKKAVEKTESKKAKK